MQGEYYLDAHWPVILRGNGVEGNGSVSKELTNAEQRVGKMSKI